LARRAVVAFAVACILGFAAVLWRAGADERSVAFSLGAPPIKPVAVLAPGDEVCQTPFPLQARAAGLRLEAGANGKPGMPLEVTVRGEDGRTLAVRRTPGGYPEHAARTVRFAPIDAGRSVSVCVRNSGAGEGYVYGDPQVEDTGTVAEGRTSDTDMSLRFLSERPRSALSLVPTMFRRASLFRFGWVGAWTFWTLAALIAIVVPLLCAFALARAVRDSEAGGTT
jgi:hypothetical protein